MSNADLLPSLLFKINQNQLALEAAVMEFRSGLSSADRRKSPTTLAVLWTPSARKMSHQHNVSGAHDA